MDGSPEILTGLFAGRYSVERELGRGATATVWLARDRESGRSVAIKVLRPELAASMGAERFLREIAVNERLHHPNIAPVLASGDHEGRLYFVLPHLEGGTLRHLMRREKQLSVERAVEVARAIASALEYAHGQGLIHRDVKPENILFSAGQACLADFGIAKAIERTIDESTTSTGLIRGTPAYMSPEQASGSKDYDGRSDQYSLACVLYEMIAGVPAFIGPTPEAIIAQRFQHAPRKLHIYRSSVSPGLEAVIERALALTPADRFASSQEFADALRDAPRQPTQESRTSAAPVTPPKRWRQIALGAIALGAASYWGVIRPLVAADDVNPDRYIVLPVDSVPGLPASELFDLIHHGFARWRGLEVVDRFATKEAFAALGSSASEDDVQRTVRSLGAGRFVRTDIKRIDNALRASVALHNARTGDVTEASVLLSPDLRGSAEAIDGLATKLLLEGDTVTATTASIAAARGYAAGLRSMRELDFSRADSLLAAAIEADATFAQASLWLAQVRAWRGQRSSSWQALVERARVAPSLSVRERRISDGLLALAELRFDASCREYEELRRTDPRDFVAWLGLGDCRRGDVAVVRDGRSPSGFRFRSDQVEAIRSYARGFEIAPGVTGSLAVGAYGRLQELLFADRSRVLRGRSVDDTTSFVAYATWTEKGLALTPFPVWMTTRGLPTAPPADRLRALSVQRGEFLRIARAWSALLPASAGAKEAVAVALEKTGEPSALDTMKLARRLAPHGHAQLRLAIEEVLLGAAIGRRDARRLAEAMSLGDSLLKGAGQRDTDASGMLAPVAALLGRCRLASGLRARGVLARDAASAGVPLFVLAAAESLAVRSIMGCGGPGDQLEEQRLVDAAVRATDTRATTSRDQIEYTLLWQSVRLSARDSAQVARLLRVSGNYHLRLMLLAARGSADSVRVLIGEQRLRRGTIGAAEYSFDGALAEARALLLISDSSSAVIGIDPVLDRTGWLDQFWLEPIQVATMVQDAVLRADLAHASGDIENATRWATYAGTVWRTADPELKPVLRRMDAIRTSAAVGR